MSIRKHRIDAGVGLLMSAVVLFSPGEILGADLTVEKQNPLTLTMDGTSAQSDNIAMYDAAVVHDDISVMRLNQGANKLGIKTLALSLGPDVGDSPHVTLYNESWFDERCLLAASHAIEVGKSGGWGSFYVDGGSLQVKELSVCSGAAVPENGVALLTLGKKNVAGKLYLNKLFNHAATGVGIRFNGGVLRPTYGSSTKLFHPESGDIILSSVEGKAIYIANEIQYAEFFLVDVNKTYAGKLRTEGDGDFVVDGEFFMSGKLALADDVILKINEKAKNTVVWGHKGDFVLKHHSVLFSAADAAPANVDTGMIRLSCKDPEHPSVFNMGSHNQTVNGIVVADGEYGKVIANAETILTVRLFQLTPLHLVS